MTTQTALARMYPEPVDRFFAFARERHKIYQKRTTGEQWPWTDDPILSHYRFTNVFRELDATTQWCKKYVRDPLADRPGELLLAVVLFRWFNRMSTGEVIFCQPNMLTKKTLFEQMLQILDNKGPRAARVLLHSAIKQNPPPYVTGSYTINTAGIGTGHSKLEGVLLQFEQFCKRDWGTRAAQMAVPVFKHGMEGTCIWLEDSPGMGGFMAYEIACDLRYTPLLQHAPDVDTWANPGPGAQRGLNRVVHRYTEVDDVRKPVRKAVAVEGMQSLLAMTRSTGAGYWPPAWLAWEMREVEHTLCEFDKYERARLGQGRPRGVFR